MPYQKTCSTCGSVFTSRLKRGKTCSRHCGAVLAGRRFHPLDLAERFWSHVAKTEDGGCWNWQASRRRHGYGQMRIGSQRDGTRRNVIASRLSWELHYGPPPPGLFVCHHCDNPSCVRPDHLFLGTAADNAHDAMHKGRMIAPPRLCGDSSPSSKLTTASVTAIRAMWATGHWSLAALGRRFGVRYQSIRAIVTHRTWRHVA